jgi:hypothetical protein
MKGKITVGLALIVAALAIATPMRTGNETGQMPPVNRSCYECHNKPVQAPVVKKAPFKKRAIKKLNEIEQKIATYIRKVNRKADAPLLARAIVRHSDTARIPPELFAAIIAHESGNFRPNLKVCFQRKVKSEIVVMCDHGLSQINDFWQAGKFDFDRIREDDEYAIAVSARILGGLHKLYSEDMPTDWWATYNTVKEGPRKVYEALVMTKFYDVLEVTRGS